MDSKSIIHKTTIRDVMPHLVDATTLAVIAIAVYLLIQILHTAPVQVTPHEIAAPVGIILLAEGIILYNQSLMKAEIRRLRDVCEKNA